MQYCRNYSAVFLHLPTFLSVGPKILIHITTNIFSCDAAWKESFRVSYQASAGICCDVITHCIHGSQKGHLCMWLVIINFPSPCWEKFLNGIKEWGVGCEELHQHPVVGQTIAWWCWSDGNWHCPKLSRTLASHLQSDPSLVQGWDPCRECLKRWQDALYCMAQ